MISSRAAGIRESIQKDRIQNDVPVIQRRKEWENSVSNTPLAKGISYESHDYSAVHTLLLNHSNSETDSLVLHFHGGGLVEGSVITHKEYASRMARHSGKQIMLFDYALAPEKPYPAAIHETIFLYQELLDQGFKETNLFFSGDSSGCNLLLASLVRLRDMGVPLPAGVLMLSPHLDLTLSGESMQSRVGQDPLTSKDVLAYCSQLYAGSADPASPEVSPLFADLSGLPAFLIQVGNDEILLSDSKRLEEKLKNSGVPATLQVWDGMWHVWPMYGDFQEAREALDEMDRFIRGISVSRNL